MRVEDEEDKEDEREKQNHQRHEKEKRVLPFFLHTDYLFQDASEILHPHAIDPLRYDLF